MEYPKTLFRSGWADLDDYVIVWSADEESVARSKGMAGIDEAQDQAPVVITDTDVAPKRRGRPAKVVSR